MERLDSVLDQIRKKAIVEAVDAMVREQIKIAGSKILYKRIDKCFKEGTMEPYFLKEQWKLFSWRERFFHHHFPLSCWYTDGSDDSHFRDTVPFQVTTNFDSLMTIAASMRLGKVYGGKVHLENDEETSHLARIKWDFDPQHGFDFNDYAILENYNELSYSFTVHQLAELHPKGPRKLEELAMRTVIMNGISLAEMSRELKKKSVDGMYDLAEDAPEHIDEVGEKHFKRVKRLFTKMKAGDDVTSSITAKLKKSFCIIRPEDLVVTDSEEEDEIDSRETEARSSIDSTTSEEDEEQVMTDNEEEDDINTAVMPAGSSNTNKRKLEEDIERELQILEKKRADLDFLRKERELLILAQMRADLDRKNS